MNLSVPSGINRSSSSVATQVASYSGGSSGQKKVDSGGNVAGVNSGDSSDVTASKQGESTKISAYARLDFSNFTFYIQTLQVVLGRRINNDQLHSVDVHLGPKKAVSRKHAKIFYNFGTQRFEISVLGRNGLFINSNFVEKGLTVPLSDGNKIQIGQVAFTFVLPGSGVDSKKTDKQPKKVVKKELAKKESKAESGQNVQVMPSTDLVAAQIKPEINTESFGNLFETKEENAIKSLSNSKTEPLSSVDQLKSADTDLYPHKTGSSSLNQPKIDSSIVDQPKVDSNVVGLSNTDSNSVNQSKIDTSAFTQPKMEKADESANFTAALKSSNTLDTLPNQQFKPEVSDASLSQLLAFTQSQQIPLTTQFMNTSKPGNTVAPKAAPPKITTSQPTLAAAKTPAIAPKKEKRLAKQPKKVYTIDEIPEPYRTKPATSYSNIIVHCLKTYSVSNKGMSLSEIYKSIQELYPYYKYCPDGWQSSVRHNLSLNKAFKKISKEGKGWLWGLDEEYFAEKDKAKKKQQTDQVRNLTSLQNTTGLSQYTASKLGAPGFSNKTTPYFTTTTLPPSSSYKNKPSSSVKPAPKLSADDKKILNILQEQLRKITKNIKGLSKETVIKMLTIALSLTMSQLQKNAAGQSLIKFVEKNPQELTKILTVSLNSATTQVTDGKMTFAELISGKVKPANSSGGISNVAKAAKAAKAASLLPKTSVKKTPPVSHKPAINTHNLKPSSIPLIPLKPIKTTGSPTVPLRSILGSSSSQQTTTTDVPKPAQPAVKPPATKPVPPTVVASTATPTVSTKPVVAAKEPAASKKSQSVPPATSPTLPTAVTQPKPRTASLVAFENNLDKLLAGDEVLPPKQETQKKRTDSLIAFEQKLDRFLAGEGDLFGNTHLAKINESAIDDDDEEEDNGKDKAPVKAEMSGVNQSDSTNANIPKPIVSQDTTKLQPTTNKIADLGSNPSQPLISAVKDSIESSANLTEASVKRPLETDESSTEEHIKKQVKSDFTS